MTENYRRALELIQTWVHDATVGLPEDVFLFVSSLTPMVNVDLLIQDENGRTLLTWRDDDHYEAGWHIPGGVIRFKETAASRIVATARDELQAEVSFNSVPLAIEEYILPNRRSRGHFISLLYACRLVTGPDHRSQFRGDTPNRGEWAWHTRCPSNLIAVQERYKRYFYPRTDQSGAPTNEH
jgi:colanic acid biosynthesis protein WcaH